MKKTHTMFMSLCAAVACASCTNTSKVRGIVTTVAQEGAISTVTMASERHDTLTFSILGEAQEMLPGDTLEVTHSGQYRPYMVADTTTIYPAQRPGSDHDSHGCIGSAGYTWSEVRKDCIRLWEQGTRLEATDGTGRSAYIVFATDSAQVELFFSDKAPNEILQRRTLPSGRYAWNMEDDDTKSLWLENGTWTINKSGNVIFRSNREESTPGLGEMEVHTYEGLLPAASNPGIEYTLSIRSRQHSGDGTFMLVLTYKEAENGQDKTFTYTGKRLTLRGIPGDDDATVWQCITEDGKQTFNFLREDADRLTLLNERFERPKSKLNYSLTRME